MEDWIEKLEEILEEMKDSDDGELSLAMELISQGKDELVSLEEDTDEEDSE